MSIRSPKHRITLLLALLCALAHPLSAAAQEPDTLTLPEAVRAALVHSTAVQRAEAGRIHARASYRESLGRMLPSVAFSTGVNHSEVLQRTSTDPITGGIIHLPDSLIDLRQTYGTQAAVSANWTVFEGGQHLAGAGASRRREQAAAHAVEAAQIQTVAEVTIAYVDALEAEAVAGARLADAARAAELERTAETRFDVGDVPEIDLLQARLAASEAEIAVLEADGAARVAKHVLLERIGISPSSEYVLVPPAEADAAPDPRGLPERVLKESPLLAELRKRFEASRVETRASRLDLLPRISVGATWARSEFGLSREAFTLDPQNTQVYYRLSLAWLPFERPGGLVAARDQARAAERAAEAEWMAAHRRMEREVASGLERLSRARALRERAALNLTLAERQREQAEERYRLGVGTLVERLTANALWAEAARQEIVARYAPLRALAEIERATGVAMRGGPDSL